VTFVVGNTSVEMGLMLNGVWTANKEKVVSEPGSVEYCGRSEKNQIAVV
jgi:hypothetical protein